MALRTTLIRDALVVPALEETPFTGWVEIVGDRIGRVGRGAAPAGRWDETLDGTGCALLPGLVNTHAHSHSSLTRGSAEGRTLEAWLTVIEREQAILTAEQEYAGAMATYAEALLSGTTAILDMCLHPAAALKAGREIGIRSIVAPYVADGKPFTPQLEDTRAAMAEAGQGDDRVRVWVGLHDLEGCSDAQIRAGAELARGAGTGVHLHCSETEFSVRRTRERTGRTPVAQLAALGALGDRTVLAHCVWVTEEDKALLAETGTHVAHCPHANLKLGSGVAPIPDLLARGVNVALATDGAKANNRLDLFDVMKFASLLHKGVSRDPTAMPAPLILDMATRRGALALGIPAGEIAAGKLADLILVRLDRLHLQPALAETVRTNLVHAARGSDVWMTMVGGQVLVRDGRLASGRQEEIRRQAYDAGLALIAGVARR